MRLPALLLAAIASTASVSGARAETLTLLIWEAYLSPALVEAFKAETGISIRQINYDSSDKRDELLADPESRVDIALVSEGASKMFEARGELAPLPDDPALRLDDYPARFRALCGSSGLPYFWGSMGIVYRTDKVSVAPTHWNDLLKPADAVKGHIAMMDDYADGLVPALTVLGKPITSVDPGDLKEAFRIMKDQAPSVLTYSYIISSIQDPKIGEELYMALAFSGDQRTLNDYAGRPDLWRYAQPEGRTHVWLDCLAITAKSKQKAEALAFLAFLSRPDNAAANAQELGFPPASTAATALLPAEALADPLNVNRAAMIENGEFGTDYDGEAVQMRKRIFSSLVNFHDAQ